MMGGWHRKDYAPVARRAGRRAGLALLALLLAGVMTDVPVGCVTRAGWPGGRRRHAVRVEFRAG